mmetsp:Transcript_8217/g.23089  ORF Transcript_8217/g.23089 Transcript_8217/m.23089 type:complete len:241 (+) Transcript_8217:2611-3333(+)
MRMPGTVSEDSAMGVARITFRQSGGGGCSTSSCSCVSSVLYRGQTWTRDSLRSTDVSMSFLAHGTSFLGCFPSPMPMLFNAIQVYMISRSPGKKTRTSPSCSSIASLTVPATSFAKCFGPLGSKFSRFRSPLYVIWTGKHLPSLLITRVLSPSSSATRSPRPPNVALMTMSLTCKSCRCCAAKQRAKLRSESILRSWNSSKKMHPTPSKLGFTCSIRTRMPSVMTSTRVRFVTTHSWRMR